MEDVEVQRVKSAVISAHKHRLPGNAKLAHGLEEIGVGFIPTSKR